MTTQYCNPNSTQSYGQSCGQPCGPFPGFTTHNCTPFGQNFGQNFAQPWGQTWSQPCTPTWGQPWNQSCNSNGGFVPSNCMPNSYSNCIPTCGPTGWNMPWNCPPSINAFTGACTGGFTGGWTGGWGSPTPSTTGFGVNGITNQIPFGCVGTGCPDFTGNGCCMTVNNTICAWTPMGLVPVALAPTASSCGTPSWSNSFTNGTPWCAPFNTTGSSWGNTNPSMNGGWGSPTSGWNTPNCTPSYTQNCAPNYTSNSTACFTPNCTPGFMPWGFNGWTPSPFANTFAGFSPTAFQSSTPWASANSCGPTFNGAFTPANCYSNVCPPNTAGFSIPFCGPTNVGPWGWSNGSSSCTPWNCPPTTAWNCPPTFGYGYQQPPQQPPMYGNIYGNIPTFGGFPWQNQFCPSPMSPFGCTPQSNLYGNGYYGVPQGISTSFANVNKSFPGTPVHTGTTNPTQNVNTAGPIGNPMGTSNGPCSPSPFGSDGMCCQPLGRNAA